MFSSASLLFGIIIIIFIATIINLIIQTNKLRQAQIAREQELILRSLRSMPKLQNPQNPENNPENNN